MPNHKLRFYDRAPRGGKRKHPKPEVPQTPPAEKVVRLVKRAQAVRELERLLIG